MQDIKDLVEEFDRAMEKRDVQAALEFFADDAKWTVPPGTFSGKDSIRRVMEWEMRLPMTYRQTGIGVLAAGNVAVREAVVEEAWEGINFDCPLLTVMDSTMTARSSAWGPIATTWELSSRSQRSTRELRDGSSGS